MHFIHQVLAREKERKKIHYIPSSSCVSFYDWQWILLRSSFMTTERWICSFFAPCVRTTHKARTKTFFHTAKNRRIQQQEERKKETTTFTLISPHFFLKKNSTFSIREEEGEKNFFFSFSRNKILNLMFPSRSTSAATTTTSNKRFFFIFFFFSISAHCIWAKVFDSSTWFFFFFFFSNLLLQQEASLWPAFNHQTHPSLSLLSLLCQTSPFLHEREVFSLYHRLFFFLPVFFFFFSQSPGIVGTTKQDNHMTYGRMEWICLLPSHIQPKMQTKSN